MLVSFGAKNFSSFKEGFEISFKLAKSCPVDISKGKSISNLVCVKGANGSGKTNILRALYFLSSFITDSFSSKPDEAIPFDSYFNNHEPSDFYVSFYLDNILYTYELTATDRGVLSERMYKKLKRKTIIFERIGNNLTEIQSEYSELQKIPNLRSNVSVISTARQFGFNVTEDIWYIFRNILSNVSYTGLMAESFDIDFINKFLFKNPEYMEFTKKIITKFDPAIKDIFIDETNINISLAGESQKKYIPWFVYNVDGETEILSFTSQSSGTKALYKQLVAYKSVIDAGGILILDEFDINLHPHILPFLLKIFLDEELNTDNAQIIFTTHNTDILDFLGRYRTYLVNKEGTESYCYRLDEIPGDILRNDRLISPAYNQGKIGGVPSLWIESLGIQKPKNF
ncbi:ATP-binding protein [Providencia huaxiensis]|nr:ATP-binding protein [Providencia huaxiensis]MDI7238388.1 ATP-binding protein [Providencia huaxiensis]